MILLSVHGEFAVCNQPSENKALVLFISSLSHSNAAKANMKISDLNANTSISPGRRTFQHMYCKHTVCLL